jgi:hypothetical protein
MSLQISNTNATVFQPENKGKYTVANISTGKKDKQMNDWINMSWKAKFVGKNQNVQDKQRIKIISGTVEVRKYQDKYYTDVVIFDWEPAAGKGDAYEQPTPEEKSEVENLNLEDAKPPWEV